MFLNSILLSYLAPNSKSISDVRSLVKRFQVLSIIYINLTLAVTCIFWKLIDWLLWPLPGNEIMITTIPLLTGSFLFLRNGQNDAAATLVIILFHAGNIIASYVCNLSLVAMSLVTKFPTLAFFLSSSPKVHIFNMVLCWALNIAHIMKTRSVFRTTFSEEQATQIFIFNLISFPHICFTWVIFYMQKSIESYLRELAQSNFEKAEKITQEVMQAVEAKDAFVSSLSHEIRNPLNSMKGSIDYLLNVVKDRAFLQVLNNAKLSGEILLNLLNNVLDAAKLKSEKMELSYTEVNITDVMKRILIVNSENLKKKGLVAEVFIDRNIPQLLWLDPSRLLQIIMNLFTNSIKFTPEKGRVCIWAVWCDADQTQEELLKPIEDPFNINFAVGSRYDLEEKNAMGYMYTEGSVCATTYESPLLREFVAKERVNHKDFKYLEGFGRRTLHDINNKDKEISRRFDRWNVYRAESYNVDDYAAKSYFGNPYDENTKKKGYLKIQVSDNGCGISQENIPKLFQMFSQANNGVASVYGGSGLGLWICRQICKKWGGDVTLYSKLDAGTTSVFYIPSHNDFVSNSSMRKVNAFRDKAKALVVDDYAFNRDLHKLLLERAGVSVSLACDGKEAVDSYVNREKGDFDFLMMDVQMPEMDGFMAAKKIREWEIANNQRKVDIYFVSGEYYQEDEVLTKIGCERTCDEKSEIRCLRKPIDVEMIKKIVEKYSQKK